MKREIIAPCRHVKMHICKPRECAMYLKGKCSMDGRKCEVVEYVRKGSERKKTLGEVRKYIEDSVLDAGIGVETYFTAKTLLVKLEEMEEK